MKNNTILVVLLLLGLGAFFYFKKEKKQSKKIHEKKQEKAIKRKPFDDTIRTPRNPKIEIVKHPKDEPPKNGHLTRFVPHTVKKGENLYSIAKKYNKSVEYLMKLNRIKRPEILFIGQKIRIS